MSVRSMTTERPWDGVGPLSPNGFDLKLMNPPQNITIPHMSNGNRTLVILTFLRLDLFLVEKITTLPKTRLFTCLFFATFITYHSSPSTVFVPPPNSSVQHACKLLYLSHWGFGVFVCPKNTRVPWTTHLNQKNSVQTKCSKLGYYVPEKLGSTRALVGMTFGFLSSIVILFKMLWEHFAGTIFPNPPNVWKYLAAFGCQFMANVSNYSLHKASRISDFKKSKSTFQQVQSVYGSSFISITS